MKNRIHSTSLFIVTLFLLLVACSKNGGGGGNNNVDCSNNSSKSFNTNVNPIIQSNCNLSGCHNSGSTNGPGPLTDYPQISSAASQIRTAVATGTMPKNSSLTTAQKNSIICWIDAGALNN